MAIDRALLKEYIAANYSGTVRVQAGAVLAFLLDQDEATQQAAIDAWSRGYVNSLKEQLTRMVEVSTELDAVIKKIELP
jgi:hypothetical protein